MRYYPGLGWVKKRSINDYIACEPEFYDNHTIDKAWSQTIEQRWPVVREGLKNKGSDPTVINELLWFVAAQYIRTETFMNRVACAIGFEQMRVTRQQFEGRGINAGYVGLADTGEVMDRIARAWPHAYDLLSKSYSWTVYHNRHERKFLTSDDPCQWERQSDTITMPVSLDMAVIGRTIPGKPPKSFRHTNAPYELVAKLNRGTVAGCNSCVYAHEDTEELRRFVEKNYVPPSVDEGGRSFTNDGAPMSEEEVGRVTELLERLRRKDREKKEGALSATKEESPGSK